jgi:hypothetical protein
MKTYVITLSKSFLIKHSKSGEPTNFRDAFNAGQVFNRGSECLYLRPKLHTIRANYPLWEKRIKEVQAGNAVLSVRQWTGKPYGSKQIEIARLTDENGVGIQKLCFPNRLTAWVDYPERKLSVDFKYLAKNDGLSLADWCDWFRHYDLSKPLAIIHFTKFRY